MSEASTTESPLLSYKDCAALEHFHIYLQQFKFMLRPHLAKFESIVLVLSDIKLHSSLIKLFGPRS